MFKAGALLSGTLASAAAAAAAPLAAKGSGPHCDSDAIRELNRRYGQTLNEHRLEDLVGLFADDAEVRFNGGEFVGRDGVRRLYVEHFGRSLEREPADRAEPVHTLVLDMPGRPQLIETAADGKSATARLSRLVRAEAAIVSHSSLAEMAREQGQGIVRWWEDGAYEIDYVRVRDGWKIRRLAYHASPASVPVPGYCAPPPRRVPLFQATFPDHPAGPDRLLPGAADSAAGA
jgi:SnoaL-like domain